MYSLAKCRPFDAFLPLEKELGRLLEPSLWGGLSRLAESGGGWSPAVDVVEEKDKFLIKADVPGVKPGEIEVTVEGGVLTLKGERRSEKKEEKDGQLRLERRFGSFSRSFNLPESADLEGVSASGNEGVLKIVIPKKEKSKPLKISVN